MRSAFTLEVSLVVLSKVLTAELWLRPWLLKPCLLAGEERYRDDLRDHFSHGFLVLMADSGYLAGSRTCGACKKGSADGLDGLKGPLYGVRRLRRGLEACLGLISACSGWPLIL